VIRVHAKGHYNMGSKNVGRIVKPFICVVTEGNMFLGQHVQRLDGFSVD
jgi:hypothetical protein